MDTRGCCHIEAFRGPCEVRRRPCAHMRPSWKRLTRQDAACGRGWPSTAEAHQPRVELYSIVRPTLRRAQAVSTRAWLTATELGVPGGLGRLPHAAHCDGRSRLRALFRTVRVHHVPVAVSSAARHALSDPSRYPVHAADSHHTGLGHRFSILMYVDISDSPYHSLARHPSALSGPLRRHLQNV